MPEQYQSLGERWYFSRVAYLAVVCRGEKLQRRLLARPAWRTAGATSRGHLSFNGPVCTNRGLARVRRRRGRTVTRRPERNHPCVKLANHPDWIRTQARQGGKIGQPRDLRKMRQGT